ncbi:MAG: DctP family TRAP transporter solute-binding subunit [Pseudomonadota bacterium]|nr:DctP family TRAP transporter solute-binding subunit [Pseudomonadota bacterium]
MRITFLAAALAAVASLGAHAQTAPAAAPAPIVIKFSHVVAIDTPKGQAAERFKAKAEKLTKGRVRIEVYPNSALYKDKEEMDALLEGKVQMLAPSLAKFSPLGIKEFEVFDVPYIFPTKQALYNVIEGQVGKSLLERLQAKGVVGLAYWDNGFKIMSANKPLKTPADFKGLKMRIQSSKVLDLEMRALGANPVPLAFSEVYAAMKSGAVDGSENTPSNIYSQNVHEVQKNMTVTDHGYLGYAVIVNKKFWDGLPPDIRTALDAAMLDATLYEKAISQVDNDRSLDAIKKSGKTTVYTPTAAEVAGFRKALLPMQQQMEERFGKEFMQSIVKVAK